MTNTSYRAQDWRSAALVAGSLLLLVVLLIPAPPASADVTGGCDGSVNFLLDDYGDYTPSNDTRSNPILVPKTDDEVAHWDGASPGDNRNHSGNVQVQIGPAWVTVAEWSHPNTANESAKFGDYLMEEFWDGIPGGRNVANGIYQARAVHMGDGADCTANVFIEFDGNPASSPVVLGIIAAVVLLTILYVLVARRAAKAALLVLAIVLAIFLGLLVALLMQQFSLWPLDTLTTFGVPLIFILLIFALRRSPAR